MSDILSIIIRPIFPLAGPWVVHRVPPNLITVYIPSDELSNSLHLAILGKGSDSTFSVALTADIESHAVDPLAVLFATDLVKDVGLLYRLALPLSMVWAIVVVHDGSLKL
jgi:hypothetical protein